MKNLIFCLIILSYALLFHCQFFQVPTDDDGDDKNKLTEFFIYIDGNFEERGFYPVKNGQYCAVWSDETIALDSEMADTIIDSFDNTIRPNITDNFAEAYDVNSDGKTAIIVYSDTSTRQVKNAYFAGYFTHIDFYQRDTGDYAYSNEMDVVYLNGTPDGHKPGSDRFLGTLAHEFQHLCNFSYNVWEEDPNKSINNQMLTWMDEGMAENASALCFGRESNQFRMRAYENDGNDRFANGNVSLILWNNSPDNYPLVYAFFAYLEKKYNTEKVNIYEKIYAKTANNTNDVHDVIQDIDKTGFDSQFISFVSALQNINNNSFPADFFPSDFTSVPECSGQVNLRPYAFVYNSSNFTNKDDDITLLTAAGKITNDINTAVAAVYTDSTAWNKDTISDINTTKQVTAPLSRTRSRKKKSVLEPVPVDYRIRKK